MLFAKLLIALLVFFETNGILIDEKIKTLSHLLTNQNFALTVNAFVCWESGKKIKFQPSSISTDSCR